MTPLQQMTESQRVREVAESETQEYEQLQRMQLLHTAVCENGQQRRWTLKPSHKARLMNAEHSFFV